MHNSWIAYSTQRKHVINFIWVRSLTFSSSKKVEALGQVEMSENYNDGLAEMIAHVMANKEMSKQIGANIASLKDVRDNNIYPFDLLGQTHVI